MHIQFLDYLADPYTKEPLILESSDISSGIILSGSLRSSTNVYPIIRGIPRFVPFINGNYSNNFGYQWHKWPRVQFEHENVGKPMEGHTRSMWEKITGYNEYIGTIDKKTIADIGCGAGRFVDVARSKGARVIGIDYSSAVEVAAQNFREAFDVCICQADALNLPLKSGYLDGAFSIGVLHHTPDPPRGVLQAHAALHAGGWFALSVYPKGQYYDSPPVQAWRKIFKILWPLFKHYPPLAYTYFAIYILRPFVNIYPKAGNRVKSVFPYLDIPDIDWSLLDTFDSVTPSYQSSHDTQEVSNWLHNAGFRDIRQTDWGPTSFIGHNSLS